MKIFKKEKVYFKLDTNEFIKRSKKVHGDKYSYSKTKYVNSRTKVVVICQEHGEFSVKPNAHYGQGHGCRKCKNKASEISFEEFLIRSKKYHGEKYSYPEQDFKGIVHDVRVICPEHGEFLQNASSHSRGHGCSKCAGRRSHYSTEDIIKAFKKIHGDKYDYSEVKCIK